MAKRKSPQTGAASTKKTAAKPVRKGAKRKQKTSAKPNTGNGKLQTIGGYLIERLQHYGLKNMFGIPLQYIMFFRASSELRYNKYIFVTGFGIIVTGKRGP